MGFSVAEILLLAEGFRASCGERWLGEMSEAKP